MIEPAAASAYLEALRTARLSGDAEATSNLFDDDVTFSIVGIVDRGEGKDALRATIRHLIAEYQFLEWELLQMVVHGDEIASRHRLKVRHRPSGDIVETESSEFHSMKGERCCCFTQFVDTARITAMGKG